MTCERELVGELEAQAPVGGVEVGVERDDGEEFPVPSTWPWTTWPPRGEPAGVGSSRLTVAPGASEARVVRAMVSPARSAAKCVGSCEREWR